MTTPDRSRFLRPPSKNEYSPLSPGTAARMDRAQEMTAYALDPEMGWEETERLVMTEAVFSAAIEGVYQKPVVNLHARALARYVASPATEESMLRMHREMMRGQAHAQPGRYRTVAVRVGRHKPPAARLAPGLMEDLWRYVAEEGRKPILQAAWAHICFETIHPFADGNGRTGRALISRILGGPLPLSRYILEHRQNYYDLLDSGTNTEWLDWFIQGVEEESGRVLEEQKRGKRS